MAELDDIGSETAAMMRTMLQMATLVALKSREHGQKDAEARAKAIEAKMKEARELQIREARDAKAKDPRNIELLRGLAHSREIGERSLQRESVGAAIGRTIEGPEIGYDSVERRSAIAAHLQREGVAPDLAEARMLMEIGRGISPEETARRVNPEARRMNDLGRELARERERGTRGIERGR
ncbi:hypothetical protein [Nocardia camponoti]|uniref:Uncharacterized protein n=1 Tax=Nocardia camponoti TaxID=1616106 RepID=A0A917QB55_9NOCA|nr:hypothetical protein [Nocardia camponoti]GGK39688.1 hypothetical protein GCM10011591_09240 [Nocardia camponoti]